MEGAGEPAVITEARDRQSATDARPHAGLLCRHLDSWAMLLRDSTRAALPWRRDTSTHRSRYWLSVSFRNLSTIAWTISVTVPSGPPESATRALSGVRETVAVQGSPCWSSVHALCRRLSAIRMT